MPPEALKYFTKLVEIPLSFGEVLGHDRVYEPKRVCVPFAMTSPETPDAANHEPEHHRNVLRIYVHDTGAQGVQGTASAALSALIVLFDDAWVIPSLAMAKFIGEPAAHSGKNMVPICLVQCLSIHGMNEMQDLSQTEQVGRDEEKCGGCQEWLRKENSIAHSQVVSYEGPEPRTFIARFDNEFAEKPLIICSMRKWIEQLCKPGPKTRGVPPALGHVCVCKESTTCSPCCLYQGLAVIVQRSVDNSPRNALANLNCHWIPRPESPQSPDCCCTNLEIRTLS